MYASALTPARAGGLAASAALVVAGVWYAQHRAPPPPETLAQSTLALAITRHDAFGAPSKPVRVVDRAKVRAVLDALGADDQPPMECPPDYATADVGIVLSGKDVYARKNAYVWDLATAPRVTIVNETGCRGGPARNPTELRTSL